MNKGRLTVYIIIAAFGLFYIVWAKLQPPIVPGEFKPTKPAIDKKKIPGPVVKVPIKVIDKKEIKKKFPQYKDADKEEIEVIDSADIPPSDNGVITITTLNTKTGEANTTYTHKKAPWFALENKTYIGVSLEASTKGNALQGYLKRDVLRVKDLHLQIEAGVKMPLNLIDKAEAHGKLNLEYRF